MTNIHDKPRPVNYRKIWEIHHGQKIPRDDQGRSYEIHHIDGNHRNNDPANLKAVTIQEHYDIHYAQGDWYACMMITLRLSLTPEEISVRSREFNRKMFADGHIFQDRKWAHERTMRRIRAGTHNFQGPATQLKKIAEGRHHFIGKTNPVYKQIANGTHKFTIDNPNDEIVTCPKCNKTGSRPGMIKWHFDNCSTVSDKTQLTCPECGKVGRGGAMNRHHFENCRESERRLKIARSQAEKIKLKQEKKETRRLREKFRTAEKKRLKEIKNLKKIAQQEQKLRSLKKPQLQCRYCGKVTDSANLTRWHGDNCKSKSQLICE